MYTTFVGRSCPTSCFLHGSRTGLNFLMMLQQQQPQHIICQDALSKFDRAVADSYISWAPTTPIHLTDNGFKFQLRVCPQFLNKPQLPSPEFQDHVKSDIARPPSLHIASVPPSHSLVINAYPALRPSYLLLTDSPTHRQSSPLDLSDIHAAWNALNQLESSSDGKKYIAIYNCGKEAGCSRSHKHMQLFPCPSDFVLFPDRSPEEIAKVPYVYDLFRLSPSSLGVNTTSDIFEAYLSGLQRARAVLGIREGEDVPHNIVLASEWILVIPRRRAGLGGVSANAAGMMGLVWMGSEDELREWDKKGGLSILSELGVTIEENYKVRNLEELDSIS